MGQPGCVPSTIGCRPTKRAESNPLRVFQTILQHVGFFWFIRTVRCVGGASLQMHRKWLDDIISWHICCRDNQLIDNQYITHTPRNLAGCADIESALVTQRNTHTHTLLLQTHP